MLRDQIRLAHRAALIRRPAFATINTIQSLAHSSRAGDAVLGVAAALIAICETNDIPVADVLRKAEAMVNDASRHSPLIDALRDYARNELNEAPQPPVFYDD